MLKSARMVDARNKVKHVSLVGRKGRVEQLTLAMSFLLLRVVHAYPCRLNYRNSLIAYCAWNKVKTLGVSPTITELGKGLYILKAKGSNASIRCLDLCFSLYVF